METTTHGPIELDAGYTPPETPGTWFNFGATKPAEAGAPLDTADPPITMFTFTALPTATTTLNGKTSNRAAHQACNLNALYDLCGFGLEFAQAPDADAGDSGSAPDATTLDAGVDGDAGSPVARRIVPFDISAYKGITFWGRTDTPGDAGGLDVEVLFPDTDTDPLGGICNSPTAGASGPNDYSQCNNSFAAQLTFTGQWQQFTVMFRDLAINPSFGYQVPGPFTGKSVYGISWQAQDTATPNAKNQSMDVWVDDAYFVR
jgi:hypothetical protein